MPKLLFPEHGRYTRKKVKGYYNSAERRVHLVYPDTIKNPFLGGGLIEDSVERFNEETGLYVSWTPVGSYYGFKDDSSELKGFVEVVV
jgi:hypothetical protein